MSNPSEASIPDPLVEAALALVPDGAIVGLGSGRAATRFIKALGRSVGEGLKVRGVPTSKSTEDLARNLGIPLVSLDEVESIDIAVDGADEVDPQLNLIKGLGGALVREKIVAAAAKKFVILVGPEKLVQTLGDHGVLPVEVVPFALEFCRRRLAALGYPSVVRQRDGRTFISDNGNPILDCQVTAMPDPAALDAAIRPIPGVVGTGLFPNMADLVLIDRGESVEQLARGHARSSRIKNRP
ncbi:MAG TPA: ribose-5-phosphate isomerase RpiA [Pirellulales bacterium]